MTDEFDINTFYDDLSKSWDDTRPTYTEEIFRKITSHLDKHTFYSILDFGCGTGLLCRSISENFPNTKIDGIDISRQMIERAKSNCPNCNFYIGDISLITLSSYDVIISKDVFNHIADIRKTILRVNGLLNTKGTVIIANRERSQDTKKEIVNALESLGYEVSAEYYTFKPTKQEVDFFINALSNFKEEHKRVVRKKLESADKYYLIFAGKG